MFCQTPRQIVTAGPSSAFFILPAPALYSSHAAQSTMKPPTRFKKVSPWGENTKGGRTFVLPLLLFLVLILFVFCFNSVRVLFIQMEETKQ